MKVCVLGAGVIGLTTAWELAKAGVEVHILDRHQAPATEASFGNGAQLSYRFVTPLATPETLRKLPAMLLSPDAPLRIRPSLDPDFLRWGLRFLAACSNARAERTTLDLLTLSALSRARINELAEAEQLDFGLATSGKLVVYRSAASFKAAVRHVEHQASSGQSIESVKACIERFQPLQIAPGALAGGIFTASEQVGDCLAFCRALAQRLREMANVHWHMGCEARALRVEAGRICAVETAQGPMEADVFVLAQGAEAGRFARRAGFYLPIMPLKGYSITVPMGEGQELGCSVTDFDKKLVFAPLNNGNQHAIRVAGMADMVGFDTTIDPRRMNKLVQLAREAIGFTENEALSPWAGLRPATPDGRPILGWAPLGNLFLNLGHGALGWTLACGSARLAMEMITHQPLSLDPQPFSLARS